MLDRFQSVIRASRMLKGPVIQKWEEFEQYAVALIVIGTTVLIALALSGTFIGQLTLLGCFVGLLICAAYYFMLVANTTAAAVTSILVALAGATIAAAHIALPMWTILLNGFGGTVLVVGLIAIWTKHL